MKSTEADPSGSVPGLITRSIRGARLGLTLLVCAVLALNGCREHETTASEVNALRVTNLPLDADDPVWAQASTFRAPLIPQDMVEPRLLKASTREVQVRAVTNGEFVAFRLQWQDATHDDLPGPALFCDACAVQLPQVSGADLPAPQMGEMGKGVMLTYWKADWQAEVDGRPLEISTLYPNASIDHYPFEAPTLVSGSEEQKAMEKRYAPAKAAGHPTHPQDRPVQDLIAEGPGTLTAAESTRSTGRGSRTPDGWQVVLTRPLPEGVRGVERTQVAFAVWDGSEKEVGARKMRSAWVPLKLEVP